MVQESIYALAVFGGFIGLLIFILGGMWKAFEKAGRRGWTSLIPLYNIYVMVKIGRTSLLWLLVLFMVPLVNLYAWYKINANVAQAFGESKGYGLFMAVLVGVGWAILGWGNYEYENKLKHAAS